MTKVAIYCGSNNGNQDIFTVKTKEIGEWMLSCHYDLVYGGGAVGLMAIIADTILDGGGHVTGVMPTFLTTNERAHQKLDTFITVENMHERKQKMSDLADIYIALPGGPGTLEEIIEVISWRRIGQHQKPCIFYNINGYYDLLAQFFDTMVNNQFLTQEDRNMVLFSESLDDIQTFIDEQM